MVMGMGSPLSTNGLDEFIADSEDDMECRKPSPVRKSLLLGMRIIIFECCGSK